MKIAAPKNATVTTERIEVEPTNEPETMVEESAKELSAVVTIDDITLHTLRSEIATSSSQISQDHNRPDNVVD